MWTTVTTTMKSALILSVASVKKGTYPDKLPNPKQERTARRRVKMMPYVIFNLDDR